jgi:hypothetical protein
MQSVFFSWLLITLLFVSLNQTVSAQSLSDSKRVEISLEVGLSYQFFGLPNYWLSPKEPRIERNPFLAIGRVNAIGIGLPVGVNIYNPILKYGLKFDATLRYDEVSPEFFTRNGKNKAVYGLFADYHFLIFRNFSVPFTKLHKKFKGGKLEIRPGIGYSFISPWQSFDYQWMAIDIQNRKIITGDEVDLSSHGICVSLGLKPTKSIGTEFKFIHISQDQLLYNYYQSSNLMVIKLYYQVPLNN